MLIKPYRRGLPWRGLVSARGFFLESGKESSFFMTNESSEFFLIPIVVKIVPMSRCLLDLTARGYCRNE